MTARTAPATLALLVAAAIFLLPGAATGTAHAQPRYLGFESSRDRTLIEPPPVVTGRAMRWHAVESVGRRWTGRTVLGSRDARPFPWGEPGPHAYGAPERDFRLIRVRVGATYLHISPWIRVEGLGSLQRLENARRQWLREHGYAGGTRTFRNPVHHAAETSREQDSGRRGPGRRKPLRDRYDWNVIEIPRPSAPRFRVRAEPDQPRRFVTRDGRPARYVTSHEPSPSAREVHTRR